MIEALSTDIFNIRVAIQPVGNTTLPANTVIKLRADEVNNVTFSSLASNTVTLFTNAAANDLIFDTVSMNYTVANANTRFLRTSIEISNNYLNAVFDSKIRVWGHSITRNWGYINGPTTVPVFPTIIIPTAPIEDFNSFPNRVVRAADNLDLTAPSIVNRISDYNFFYIKGLSPNYIHRSTTHKIAFAWEDDSAGNTPNNGIILYTRSDGNNFTFEAYSNGVNVGKTSNVNLPNTGLFSVAFTANTSTIRYSLNGGAIASNNYNIPADWTDGLLRIMRIGRGRGDASHLGGTIKIFRFERRESAVQDSELISVSANTF